MTRILRLRIAAGKIHAARNATKQILTGMVLAAALSFYQRAEAQVDLGTAGNFAVLAGSAVTSTGATTVNGGNVGVFAGTAITGFPPATITPPYTIHAGDAVAQLAQSDLAKAYNTAAGLAPNQNLTGQNLGGMTLTPGVYFFSSSAQITGILTLNDQGNPNAQFVFQIGSTLTTASGSSVVTINDPGAAGLDTFWQVGTSATLGTGTAFEGNILAAASITATTGATFLDGRLLAENGAVTLDDNTIMAPLDQNTGGGGTGGSSVPDAGGTLLLFGSAVVTLLVLKRRAFITRA